MKGTHVVWLKKCDDDYIIFYNFKLIIIKWRVKKLKFKIII